MTVGRRGFLKLLGASVGIISAKSFLFGSSQSSAARKILVAHRGASAYAPEHTIESYALALRQGADYVEQDLQITKDGVLVCVHDMTLERTTNVKEVFPTRSREEQLAGTLVPRWYVHDFTLREIRRLDAGSWFDRRFQGARVPTFQEAIDLVRGKAGLYPETKAPEVYGQRGFDMERLLLNVLRRNNLHKRSSASHTPVIIQSFSPESLKKLATTLGRKMELVLLVGEESRLRWLDAPGLAESKKFATGIGPAKAVVTKSLVMEAHELGLSVTPYTFRSSNTGAFKTVREEMSYYLYELGVDALFTDNPDQFPRYPVKY